ncbi:hypothetical protein GA0115240_12214 [Streptomyces sp. DvalAA-14]|uniref:hypothetical protein n=1 Tax=unclassified Streptomyces TaxID=2593676 RepID=UPI00081AFF24|nr:MULTISPECIES: hypothetical protein [unclassified Streptomyces]MYS20671.1 hypothetical protein [Streptomyces sp. SID4948]SCD74322.1 hypothetical protein GA0115240_12214 [Streptomyces sp. DvalAA-14]
MSPRSTRRKSPSALKVTGGDGVFVLHGAGPLPDQLAHAARVLTGASGVADQATVLVGAGFDDPDALCDELAPAFDACATSGVTLLRLVMSGGAAELPDRAAPARRITERWSFDVLAPAGAAVVVPGGTLFAPDLPDAPGAWWQFSRGLLPRRLGARHPEPAWQQALDRVAVDTAEGCVVHHVPAGLLVLPAGVPPEGVDAVRYALPVDPAGPVLLVGAFGTAPVPADALADVVAALPAQVRGTVRLLPGDGRDLLPTGQQVADLLGIEVQVANGLPVLLDDGSPPDGSPWEQPIRGTSARTMLLDADGNPSWRPYVEAVSCAPAAKAPRLTGWRAPIGGLRPAREPGALLLDRHWQVAVTRAGLWIGPQNASVPAVAAARPVEPDVMAIDLGLPGRPLNDSTLWPPLQRLFAALQDDVRERTMIQVHGEATPEALRELRRLAVQRGLALSPRGWRPVVVGAGPSAASVAPGVGAASGAVSGAGAGAAASGAGAGAEAVRERRRLWRSAGAGAGDGGGAGGGDGAGVVPAASGVPVVSTDGTGGAPAAAASESASERTASEQGAAASAHVGRTWSSPGASAEEERSGSPASRRGQSGAGVGPEPSVQHPHPHLLPPASAVSVASAEAELPAAPAGGPAPKASGTDRGRTDLRQSSPGAGLPAAATSGSAQARSPLVEPHPDAPRRPDPAKSSPAAPERARPTTTEPQSVPRPPAAGDTGDGLPTATAAPTGPELGGGPVAPEPAGKATAEQSGTGSAGPDEGSAAAGASALALALAPESGPASVLPEPNAEPSADSAGTGVPGPGSGSEAANTATTKPELAGSPVAAEPAGDATAEQADAGSPGPGDEPTAATTVPSAPEPAGEPPAESPTEPAPDGPAAPDGWPPAPVRVRVSGPDMPGSADLSLPETPVRLVTTSGAPAPQPEPGNSANGGSAQPKKPASSAAEAPAGPRSPAGVEPPAAPAVPSNPPGAGQPEADSAAPVELRAAAPAGSRSPAGVEPSLAPAVPSNPPGAGLPEAGSAAPGTGRGGAAPVELRAVAWVPVRPSHRSTEAERDTVRAYLAGRWDHHSGAVNRALTRVPALRSAAHPEEAAADLAALHAYATAAGTEGPWTHDVLRAALDAGRTEPVAFLGCLASGLRRLPSYRGAAVRSAGGALGETAELLLPGEELGDVLPVSAVAVDRGYPSVAADHYLIWSMTGRRANSLLGDADAVAAGAAGAGTPPVDEVLFAPGTRLRVLAVDDRAGSTVVLLRELPDSAPPATTPGLLDDADQAVLKRLRTLKDQPTAVGSGRNWPDRSAGALGVLGTPHPPDPGGTTS